MPLPADYVPRLGDRLTFVGEVFRIYTGIMHRVDVKFPNGEQEALLVSCADSVRRSFKVGDRVLYNGPKIWTILAIHGEYAWAAHSNEVLTAKVGDFQPSIWM